MKNRREEDVLEKPNEEKRGGLSRHLRTTYHVYFWGRVLAPKK